AEFRAEFPDAAVFLTMFPEDKLAQISAIIVSPGVPLETPCIVAAKVLNIPVFGDIECLAREIPGKQVIAITGTNGKSTVTTLVGLMAEAFGFKTAVAGNIGTPVLDLLADENDYAVWVLELSSFQLDVTESLCPTTATVLNITPDHLDRYHTIEAYIAAKQRVYHHAVSMVYNREDELTIPDTKKTEQVTSFGLNPPSDGEWGLLQDQNDWYLAYGQIRILAVSDLRIKGRHNWANALAACALVHPLGIPFTVMREVLMTFSGLPHRSQWVRTLDAVDWINDSKGTNVGATQSAIAGIGGAISGKIVLIAGGQGKGADFRFLRDVVANHVRALVLLGQDADILETALSDLVPVKRIDTIEAAVQAARDIALSGDVVLLSPACASLDMFRDFNHRGQVFTDLVGKL
ncbi:MAG: UDP-N-acetylmuramoyl-L-alanine--D-glutamate ligase, partial [Legionellales bacterium]|nr:UDP-N-acetylmuramoyl-L-alanine--D-glutamate ligase [Legionellales bacterium]